MYIETVNKIADMAKIRVEFYKKGISRYFVSSAMAGVFVGLGIVLIFSIGAPFAVAESPALKIIMGISFGVALTIVIFAGAELSTGNFMVMTMGSLKKKVKWADTVAIWILSYIGNLAGSIIFAYLIAVSGLLNTDPQLGFVTKVVAAKMGLPMIQLFIRGIFCNMLVCLAIWMGMRAREDIARLVLIFWCLFAFIGSGYEHSVANMSLMGLPLFITANTLDISWAGYFRNLIPVTLGNLVGGAIFIGMAYHFISADKNIKKDNYNH